MTNSMLAATLVLLINILFIQHSHSRDIIPMDAKLIEQTCNKTPHPSLCVSSLKSDPHSASADVPGLALIMVNVVSAKVNDILRNIDSLLKQRPGDKSLKDCSQGYHGIQTRGIRVAKDAITKGNPKFAEEMTNAASIWANLCERRFKGRSPLTNLNKVIDDVSRVTSAIIKILE